MVYSSIIELYNKQSTYTEHYYGCLDCFAPLSYKTAFIRAIERECIPRGRGALAGQLRRCLKTIVEIGPHEDRVLFQAGQCTRLSSFKVRTMVF